MKEIDLLDKFKAFDDTLEVVKVIKEAGLDTQSKHLHELWTLSKHLATEVKRLRKSVR
jgi:hypothetical protein